MANFVRASKFRHVYCDTPKPDATFQNLRLSTVTGEQNYIKANPLYFAVGLQVIIFLLKCMFVDSFTVYE
jgi:coronin-1B/1C/6